MTTTPESRQEPTAAQLIAIALGTAPPVTAEAAPGDTGAVLTETTPTAPPPFTA